MKPDSQKSNQHLYAKTNLADILDRVSDAFIALDESYHYIYVNQRTCDMVRKKAEDLIGRNVWEVFPDAVGSNTYIAITEAMEQQHYVSSTDYYAPLDLWQENNVYPSANGVSVFIRDISAAKKAEQALIKNESRYRKLIENNFDVIYILDAELNVTYQSPSAEKLSGWTADERINNKIPAKIDALVHPDDLPELTKFTREILGKPGKECFIRLRIQHKDGHYIWVEGCATSLFHDMDIGGVLFNIRNISAHVEYEQKLLKSQRLYAFISQVNQTIVHTTERQELFDTVCRIARDVGNFDRSWIGLIDESGARVNMVAHTGIPDDELPSFKNIDPFARDMRHSALYRVLSFGEYVITNNISEAPVVPIWKGILKVHEQASIGIFPIRIFGKTIGIMSFLISAPDFFDKEEISLLVEAVGDVSFALEFFEKEIARKNSETQLALSESRLHRAQKIAHLGSWVVDLKTNQIVWSDEVYRIVGMEPGEIRPHLRSITDMVHPDDAHLFDDVYARVHNLSSSPSLRFRIVRRNGTIRYIHTDREIELDHTGQAVRLVGIIHDETEQQEAEQKIISNEKRFRALIENNYDAILIFDDKFETLYRSPSAERMSGWGDDHINGETRFEYIHADDLAKTRDAMAQCAAEPGRPVTINFRFKHRDGYYMWGEGLITDLRHDENIRGYLFNFRDITDRKNAEIALHDINESLELKVKERTAELTEANLSLDSFSYSVSHDLRSPLGSIIGFITIIQTEYDTVLTEEVKEMLMMMESSARRMNSIIEDLLQLARFSREKLEIVPIDLKYLVHHVWDTIQKQIAHEASLCLLEMPCIHASPSMIEQVMINLISNAVKYSSKVARPVITIGSIEEEKCYTIFVKDNGTGFDMQYYSRLFKPFHRLHTATDFEGTGIGLTLAKRIIERHNGKIWAESEPEKGATFYFTLPRGTL